MTKDREILSRAAHEIKETQNRLKETNLQADLLKPILQALNDSYIKIVEALVLTSESVLNGSKDYESVISGKRIVGLSGGFLEDGEPGLIGYIDGKPTTDQMDSEEAYIWLYELEVESY